MAYLPAAFSVKAARFPVNRVHLVSAVRPSSIEQQIGGQSRDQGNVRLSITYRGLGIIAAFCQQKGRGFAHGLFEVLK